MDLQEFSDICEKNYKNYKDSLWQEDNESDMLAYFFQFENIFKTFLKSVLKSDIYCKCTKDDKFETKPISEDLIARLKFKKYRFPMVRVKTTEINEKKEMDLLIEGENFICVIENKMKAPETEGQCKAYKEEVYKRCCNKEGKTPICIYIDNEHSSKCISKDKFPSKQEVFGGYYLAYQGENVLQSLLKCECENEITQDLENFCNFLKEATLKENDDLQKEIDEKREELEKILSKNGFSVEYKENVEDLYINNKLFEKYKYLKLLCNTEHYSKISKDDMEKELTDLFEKQ